MAAIPQLDAESAARVQAVWAGDEAAPALAAPVVATARTAPVAADRPAPGSEPGRATPEPRKTVS
jgi:hypothetical protein